MYARSTLFEIDTLRTDPAAAVETFKDTVLPELRKQPGCLGVFVMNTPLGKGMLLSLWESGEAADASLATGFYDQQLQKVVTLLRQPPGREHYEVAYWELAESMTAGAVGNGATP